MNYIRNISELLYSSLGLNPRKFFVITYGLAVVWNVVCSLLFQFFPISQNIADSTEPIENIDNYLIAVLLIAPLFETLIFQFAIQNTLRYLSGNLAASIMLTTVLFSSMHLVNSYENAINTMAVGLAFGLTFEYIRLRFGNVCSILSVSIIHFFWNSTVVIGIGYFVM